MATVRAPRGPRLVGAAVRRPTAPRFLRGVAQFLDDVQLPGLLQAALLRSPHAHARVRAIDVAPALALPGVHAALTAADVAPRTAPLPAPLVTATQKQKSCPVLSTDKVRYVGEPLAIVAAADRYLAEDAVERIAVDYEVLPAVTDMERALDGGATLLYDDWGDNVAFTGEVRGGDFEQALAEADVVLRERFSLARCSGVPLETRGAIAAFDQVTGDLTLWSSTQVPHDLRSVAAEVLGLPTHHVRVLVPDVGGGFGNKDHTYPEEILVCLLAMQLGRPVKWLEDRREHLLATVHAREQIQRLELAAKRDGTILGVRSEIIADAGANVNARGPGPVSISLITTPGPYRFAHYHGTARGVVTNKTPFGGYRGYGNPQSVFTMERMVDLLARHLGLDPAEVRLRNMIQPAEMPFTSAAGRRYDSGDYPEALRKVLALIEYPRWRAEQARLREQGRYVGIGMALNVESTGLGPAAIMERLGWRVGGHDTAIVRMADDATVTVYIGTPTMGQGLDVTVAQICADVLDRRLEDVRVVWNDTAQTPYSGLGTIASRAAAVVGSAVVGAARGIRDKLLAVAAHQLEVAPDDLELVEGRVQVRGTDRGVPLTELARQLHSGFRLPPGVSPGLHEQAVFEPPALAFAYMSQAAVVEVDPETGAIAVLRYAGVDDCGTVINPAEVEGQLTGGIAQGLGEALLEELVYTEDGQLLSGSLMDYLLPTAVDVPPIALAHLAVPTPHFELGIKGVGEAGVITPPAVIANAVADALAPFGVQITRVPVTPGYVRELLDRAGSPEPIVSAGA
jgi:aerobic carbon-monoxide dehydrogenase large subunit